MESIALLSSTTRVEVPFICVKIGSYTFGLYSKQSTDKVDMYSKKYKYIETTFPNYLQSLTVNKINGAVNTYTLQIVYPVKAGADPNLLDKVFSSVSKDRKIIFSYGDYASPTFIYRNESAIITDVTSNINLSSSIISYTVQATSEALLLSAGAKTFPAYLKKKPSDRIKEILKDQNYGLQDIFYGMRNPDRVEIKNLIASDDREVAIARKEAISVIDYLGYLVNMMSCVTDTPDSLLKSYKYALVYSDEFDNKYGGPYFKVVKIPVKSTKNAISNMYTLDAGYPGNTIITGINIMNNEAYSILYNYSNKIKDPDLSARIDANGDVEYLYAPEVSNSSVLFRTTEAEKTWWSQMIQYPIKCEITIKGLLKPAILMNYIYLNVLFYGRKHTASGIYIITKQVDTISGNGYSTKLSLTRISSE